VPDVGVLPELGMEPDVGGLTCVGRVVCPVLGLEGDDGTTVLSLAGGVILTGVTDTPLPRLAPSVEGAEPRDAAGPPGAAPEPAGADAEAPAVELDVDPPPKGSWKLAWPSGMAPAFGASWEMSDFTAEALAGTDGLGLGATAAGGEADEAGWGAVR
jgi:hypothetical protein